MCQEYLWSLWLLWWLLFRFTASRLQPQALNLAKYLDFFCWSLDFMLLSLGSGLLSRCCFHLLLAALPGLLHPGGEGLSLEVPQLRDLLAAVSSLHQLLEQEEMKKSRKRWRWAGRGEGELAEIMKKMGIWRRVGEDGEEQKMMKISRRWRRVVGDENKKEDVMKGRKS